MRNISVETVKFSRKAYELPLLQTIIEFGGGVTPCDEIYNSIAEKMGFADNQGDYDMAHAKSKWVYELQWVRWQLTKNGELDGTQRGLWKITDAGRQRVNTKWRGYNRDQYIIKPDNRDIKKSAAQVNDLDRLGELANACLEGFYQDLESMLSSLELQDLLIQVDPYVLCLTGTGKASTLIESLLDDSIAAIAKSTIGAFVLDPWSGQTGAPDKIIKMLDEIQHAHRLQFEMTRARTANRLTLEFCNQFLLDDGSLDFAGLVRYTSVED